MTLTKSSLRRAPERGGAPSAMARYATLTDARSAIEALERHGVDGVDIVLAGWRADAAERSRRTSGADGQFVRYLGWSVIRGAVPGGVIGMLLGAIAAGIVLAFWDVRAWGLVLGFCAGFGAGLGALIGSFVDVERHVGFSDAWALTLQDIPDGSIWVLVFDHTDRARDVVLRTNPVELRAPPVAA
jgi:MFS family permease